MIGYEEHHGPIRNRRHASQVIGPSKLDPVVTADDQLAWLNGTDFFESDETIERIDDPQQRRAGAKRFDQLLGHPAGPLVALVLRDFVWSTIPRPRETERRFWSVSAVPSTGGGGRLATLSVGNMETMFLYLTELAGDVWLGGCVNVTASAVAPDVLDGALNESWAYVDRVGGLYESSGVDLAGLRFLCTEDHYGYDEAMSWPGVADAARTLALRLMRKGLSLQGHWHNYPLADVLLDDVPWPWPDLDSAGDDVGS
jgi:hypothetical protein